MFSNEINTKDLFFSNPMDVFLAQDHSNKTKYESGISSSFSGYNQTGNSADVRCRSSQDLFSQFEKTDSQYEANYSGYQKYVSQNLLLDPSPKGPSSFRDDEARKKKSLSPINENKLKDIRQLLDTLNEGVRKLNLEINLHNDKVNFLKEEVFKLNEKLNQVEESIGKKLQLTDENNKAVTKLIKKEVFNRISEINSNVTKVEKKVDEYTEQSEMIFKETFKNISKSHEISNKKQLQNIQTLYSKIDNTVQKMDVVLDTSVKDIKTSFEKMFEQNMQDLKSYISHSMQHLVTSSDNLIRNSMVPDTTKLPQQKSLSILQNNMYAKNNSAIITEGRHSEFNCLRNGIMKAKIPQNQTPLAYYLDRDEKLYKRNDCENFRNRSYSPTRTPEYKDAFRFTNLNIKRKVSTPLSKLISPYQTKMKPNTNIDCRPIIKRRSNTTLKANRDKYEYNECTPSRSSTPGFSVFQIARLTKDYTSDRW